MAGEIIRPKDLTPRPSPVASELMVVDNSVNVGAATIKAIVEAGRPAASQAEAQAGTDAAKAMTPLTTKQSIAAEVGVSVASKAQGDLAETAVQSVAAGANVTIDSTDPRNLVVSTSGGVTDGDKGDVVVSGAGAVWAVMNKPMPTVTAAITDSPALDPAYYDIAYYDTSYQTGSGAKYRKRASEPSHLGKFQNANGAWYEIDAGTLRPEMFGRIGVNAAGDTAAWVALASAANSRADAYIVAEGRYQLAGSTVLFDGSLTKLTLRLLNAEFFQKTIFSKTLRFANIPEVRVHGGYFEGLGGGSGEYNGNSSSYNGVAAMHFFDCAKVWVSSCTERLHAGGGFVVQGGRLRRFENIECEGIGFPFIDPIGQGNQGNGSDFGIMCQPTANDNTQLFRFEDRFVNVRTFNHAFGIQTVATKSLVIRGCEIGPCPGQHGVYAIDCDGINVQGNTFLGCRQFGFKQQYENYAGRFMAPVWQPTTAYGVGDKVLSFSFLYVCHTAHTSGASFSATNWSADVLNRRNGGLISNNIFDGQGQAQSQALGLISTTFSDTRAIYTRNLMVTGNTVRNYDGQAFYIERALDSDFLSNTFDNCKTLAMLLREYRGRVSGNTFRNVGYVPVQAVLSGDMYFEGNKALDCALLWTGAATSTSASAMLSVTGRGANTIPDMPTARRVNFDRNEIRFSGTESPGSYLFFAEEADTYWRVTETRYDGAKIARVNGGTTRVYNQFRNDFTGYLDTSQNESVPTDAATLITNLRAKRVIK